PKISDFGFSRGFGLSWSSWNIAAVAITYIAPEVLKGEPTTWAADVYSLGMIMWEISASLSRRPFQNRFQDSAALRNAIIDGLRENPADSVSIPPYYINMYQHCWASEMRSRPFTPNLLIHLRNRTSFDGALPPIVFEI